MSVSGSELTHLVCFMSKEPGPFCRWDDRETIYRVPRHLSAYRQSATATECYCEQVQLGHSTIATECHCDKVQGGRIFHNLLGGIIRSHVRFYICNTRFFPLNQSFKKSNFIIYLKTNKLSFVQVV